MQPSFSRVALRTFVLLTFAASALVAPSFQGEWEHRGPAVAPGETGPARFVAPLLDAFDAERAFAFTKSVDRHYRAPGNDGYEAALDLVLEQLHAVGFRASGDDAEGAVPGLELRVIETKLRSPAWTPVSARLEVVTADNSREVLHAFDTPEGRDRVMLPVEAPSADVRGRVVFGVDELGPGTVLVTDAPLGGGLLRRARRAGAAAVLSSSLSELTVDPRDGERHLDAIAFTSVPTGTELAVAQISPRSHARITALLEAGEPFELALNAVVRFDERPLRTVVASFVGTHLPGEVVVVPAHVQEPGAGDNASGVGGMLEGAVALAGALARGELEAPLRTLELVWGDEIRQSSIWLQQTQRRPIAAFSADMLGQSESATGAICLLERGKDPGAVWTIEPDAHTPWGAGRVEADDFVPDGLAIITRTALADVARAVGGWRTAEHPWEGGSDHDVFLAKGIPAVLVWHFTDFTYHTGLDRTDMLDADELERTSVTLVAAALAVADARPADLERHLASLALDRELRVTAATNANEPAAVEAWKIWFEGADAWLRALCAEPAPTSATTEDTGAPAPEPKEGSR